MNSDEINKENSEYVGNIKSYILGFIASLVITITAYELVVNASFTGWTLAIIIILLAILQCYVQLIFFLHLNKSAGTQWRLATFIFALLIIIIIGGGSLWIMHSLNGRMTSTQDMIRYMDKETGI